MTAIENSVTRQRSKEQQEGEGRTSAWRCPIRVTEYRNAIHGRSPGANLQDVILGAGIHAIPKGVNE
jgi:hypothetical protein